MEFKITREHCQFWIIWSLFWLVVYAWHGEWLGVFILCIVGATATTMFKKLGKKEAK